ncbi:AAA family ATPase [Mesorhizobium sp. DCY119]|uniref:AAA family ATPase n=1 Tax=Mesorhizobium sp. DCY119 TaxID=2108445 RepID=UPI000E72009B|nr:AAA family ATPase [Mesorhizobium sp. DCY119]RJG40825.1 hypothetical protein D3Y55_26705 [Mesorhizobium sp. DCY119]
MRISFVELSGFRGFKETTRFVFPAGFVVLTGRNGAGKSTVLDAVDYVLTGTIDKFAVKGAKGGGLDSHIWWVGDGAPSHQYATVGLVDDRGDVLEISRSRDRGLSPSINELGALLCSGSVGTEWARTLVQTTLIRDETLASLSMDLPEQARFEAVRAAIGGLSGPDHSARTGELVKAAQAARSAQETRLAQMQTDLGRSLSALTEARSAAERQLDVAEAEASIQRIAPHLDRAASDIAERVRRLIATRKQSVQTIESVVSSAVRLADEFAYFNSEASAQDIQRTETWLATLGDELGRANSDVGAAEAAVVAERSADAFASQMILLLRHGEEIGLQDGHCPLCDAARTDHEFSAAISAMKARLSTRGESAATAQARLAAVLGLKTDIAAQIESCSAMLAIYNQRRANLAEESKRIQAAYAMFGIDSEPSNIEGARLAALKWQEDTAELEHALFILEASAAHDRVSALEARVDALRASMEEEEIKFAAADRALEAAKQIDKSVKSVANQVLTEQFDTVMPLLKELYQRLRPHTDWREIETDFGGNIRASLNFTVGDGRNPQFLFSSGQRRAAGLAFLLAIHLSRPWSKLRSLLLDDPVQHIDDYRALNLVEVLSSIRRSGQQVIVAVEDPALADLLCRRLRSSPEERGRRFELSMNSNGSAAIARSEEVLPMLSQVLDFERAS